MLIVQTAADGKGKRLTTTQPIQRGAAFHTIANYRFADERTYTSVQIDSDESIEEHFLAHLNHSCNPNVIIDATSLELRAIRDIQPGEDLTFFYPSTEWAMAEPFTCLCGTANCIGTISGARDLPLNVLGRYFINRHIGGAALEHLVGKGIEAQVSA
ncbi:MAG: SET domain-containing protein-lysine N-methyltransferase [Leptolyngbyaceae cyanobacterium]